jgi:hypothetical protein
MGGSRDGMERRGTVGNIPVSNQPLHSSTLGPVAPEAGPVRISRDRADSDLMVSSPCKAPDVASSSLQRARILPSAVTNQTFHQVELR